MVYFIQCGSNGPIKIGFAKDPKKRVMQLQTGSPYKLNLLWAYQSEDPADERDIHAEFEEYKIRGEWYSPSDRLFEFMETFSGVKY
jgi:hypothetical protein